MINILYYILRNFNCIIYINNAKIIGLITFLILCFQTQIISANAITFANLDGKYYGTLIKIADNYYAYTSQTALLNLGDFILKSSNGKDLKKCGELEISYYNDIARIKVEPQKEQLSDLYEISNSVVFNQEVKIIGESDFNTTIEGIGRFNCYLKEEFDLESTGTPVLSTDGKIIAIISEGYSEFKISEKGNKNKVSVIKNKNHIASRLDVKIKWIPVSKAGFTNAIKTISDVVAFQNDFLDILNWWYNNPYLPLPSDIKYPPELNGWVKAHNAKTRNYEKLISKSSKNSNIMDGLINNTHRRGIKFSKIPQVKLCKLQTKWKTSFLKKRTKIYMKNWKSIKDLLDARLISMKYKLPQYYQ